MNKGVKTQSLQSKGQQCLMTAHVSFCRNGVLLASHFPLSAFL